MSSSRGISRITGSTSVLVALVVLGPHSVKYGRFQAQSFLIYARGDDSGLLRSFFRSGRCAALIEEPSKMKLVFETTSCITTFPPPIVRAVGRF